MSEKKGLFSKVGKTRIVPLGLKILIIFVTIILLSNFATNFLSVQLSKRQIINLNNTIMVEQLKGAQFRRQQRLGAPGLLHEKAFPCGGVQQPHCPGPEAAGPPAVAVEGRGPPPPSLAAIGQHALAGSQRRGGVRLFDDPVQYLRGIVSQF